MLKRTSIPCLSQVGSDSLTPVKQVVEENKAHLFTNFFKNSEENHLVKQKDALDVHKPDESIQQDHHIVQEEIKVSNFHKRWSKLKKYISKKAISSVPNASEEIENPVRQDIKQCTILSKNKCVIRKETCVEGIISDNTLEPAPSISKLRNSKSLHVESALETDSNFLNIPDDCSLKLSQMTSGENVERWLKYYHDESDESHKSHNKRISCFPNDERLNFSHSSHRPSQKSKTVSSHRTHKHKKRSSRVSLEEVASLDYPIIDLEKVNFPRTSNLLTKNSQFNSHCTDVSQNAFSELNPSLIQFVTELMESLENMQSTDLTELEKSKLSSHLITNVDKTKNFLSTSSCSDNHKNNHLLTSVRAVSKKSTPHSRIKPPEESANSFSDLPGAVAEQVSSDENHQDILDDVFYEEKTEFSDLPRPLTTNLTIGCFKTTSEELSSELGDKERVYDFHKDPMKLLQELKTLHRKARASNAKTFQILEQIIIYQSGVIKKLQSELRSERAKR